MAEQQIQIQQKRELLELLSLPDIIRLAQKNNLSWESKPKEILITSLLQLSGTSLVNGIGKGYLTVYLAKYDIHHQYVKQMREAVQEVWLQERLKLMTQSPTIPAIETPPTKIYQSIPTQPQYDNTISLRTKPEMAAQPLYDTQRTLADQFCNHFYTLLHGSCPQEIINSGMFSQHAVVYLFLFSHDGETLLAEKKVEGVYELQSFISMLAKYTFSLGNTTEDTDDFGNLQIVVKGNIVVDGDKYVGIFTHFYKFFKPELNAKYIIREASFHMKTQEHYQPLRNVIPYKVLQGFQ